MWVLKVALNTFYLHNYSMTKIKNRGFTLIEVLIVVAIIGILASVAIVGLGPIQRRGRDSRRISDLRNIQNGLELYFNRCGFYPSVADCGGATPAYSDVDFAGMKSAIQGTASLGVRVIPNDPLPASTYGYKSASPGTAYVLSATLEDGSNSALSDPSRFKVNAAGAPPTGSFSVDCSAANILCLTL